MERKKIYYLVVILIICLILVSTSAFVLNYLDNTRKSHSYRDPIIHFISDDTLNTLTVSIIDAPSAIGWDDIDIVITGNITTPVIPTEGFVTVGDQITDINGEGQVSIVLISRNSILNQYLFTYP